MAEQFKVTEAAALTVEGTEVMQKAISFDEV
jgi:hypothetical protein